LPSPEHFSFLIVTKKRCRWVLRCKKLNVSIRARTIDDRLLVQSHLGQSSKIIRRTAFGTGDTGTVFIHDRSGVEKICPFSRNCQRQPGCLNINKLEF
jgi:hypothetical protein